MFSLSSTIATAVLIGLQRSYSSVGPQASLTSQIWKSVFEDPYLTDTLCDVKNQPYQEKLPRIGQTYLCVLPILENHPVVSGFVQYLRMAELLDDALSTEVAEVLEGDIHHHIAMMFYREYVRETTPRVKGIKLPDIALFFELIDES